MSSWYDSLLADFCLTVGFASIDLQYRCKFRSVYEDRDGLVWTLEYRLRSRVDSGSSIGGSASSGQLCLKFWFITMPIHLSLALRPSYWFPSNVPAWCSRCLSDGGCSQSMPCYVCPTRFLSIPCWIPYKHWPAKHGLLENPPFGSMIVPFTSGFPDCPGLFFCHDAGLYWSRRSPWLRGLPFHGGHRHFVGAVDQCGHRGVVQSLRLSNRQVLEFQGMDTGD